MKLILTYFILLSFIFSIDYDLESLIDIGLEKNIQMKLAKEDKKQSLANSIEARSNALPKIQFISSGTKNYDVAGQLILFPIPFGKLDPVTGSPIAITENPGLQQTDIILKEMMFSMGREYSGVYGININQTLFDGRVFAAIRASNSYKKFTDESYNAKVGEVIEKIKTSYYTFLLTKKVTEVFNKSLNRSQENFTNTELLYNSGKVNKLELIRAESALKDQESFLKNAEKSEIMAFESLKLIVGLENENDVEIVGSFSNKNSNIPNLNALEVELLNNQPLLKQSEASFYLLKENVHSYLSEFLPSISISGSIHKMQSNDEKHFTVESFQNNSSISLNFGLPIFDGFGSSARVMHAKAAAKKAKYQSEDIKNNLMLELKSIHLTLIETKEIIDAGKKKLELAEKGYEIAKDLYENGMTTQLDLFGAELSLNQAELNLLQGNFEHQITQAKLSRAIGKNTKGN